MGAKIKRRKNPAGELPFGEWIPAHAVMFRADGPVELLTEGAVSNRGRRRNQSDSERDELRLKQDFLIMLAVDNAGFPESYRITDHAGAPTLSDLRAYIYPDWEHAIDQQIRELAREQRVGVPDFGRLTPARNRGRRRNPSAIVSEIHRQLRAQGIGPRVQFVEWDANTLKVSRGTDGVLIHYNRGMDLYDIDEYHGGDVRPFRENVYAEDLLQVIEPALHRARFGNRGRRRF